ncbi:MAG: amidohydrolase, partial [Gammaproteobacteria bacterium]
GFTDAHQHLEGVGRRTKTLSLFGIDTLSGTVQAIEQWATAIPEDEWILGRGWIEREWTDEQRFLTKHDVDAFTMTKPLFMPRADGVSALVNSAALRLAGVTRATPDPEGGRFDRNEDGEPTGYVLGNAMKPFRAILPDDTGDYLKDNLIQGLKANAAMGWTQTQDAGMSYRLVDLLKTIHQEGRMTHRVYVAVPVSEAMERFKRGREKTDDDFLDVRGIKVFIDGTLGSRGAALIDNYADSDHNGFMGRTPKSTLMPILRQALTDGVQIETHVIGDRAVRSLLDWYDEAFNATPRSEWASSDLRWRLEHAQIIQPGDQDRFVSLGILPSMQPSHGIGDLNFAPARLGSERLQYAYPWRDLVDKGLKILGGSDAPVELGDPRIEFYAAIARKRLDGTSGDGWHPELAVSRETALKMFTIWPAYGAFQDHLRGSIEVGKYADFTVFDRDLMTVPADNILNAKVVMTMVGGKIAYDGRSEPE